MRRMNKGKGLALCVAAVATSTAGAAMAQVTARVGGELAVRDDGRIVAATAWQDNTVAFAQRLPAATTGTAQLRGWTQWNAWTNLGGASASTPVTIVNANGKALVVGRRSDNQLYWTQETTAGRMDCGAWSKITSAALVGKPAVVRRQNGVLEIYAMDSTGKMSVLSQTSAGGSWASWVSLGNPTNVPLRNSPVAAVKGDAVYLFASGGGTNNHLFMRSQPARTAAWTAWSDFGGTVSAGDAVLVGTNAGGLLSVFIRSSAGTIGYKTQVPNSSAWTNTWTAPSTTTGSELPAVANHADGRLALFSRTNGGGTLSWQSQTAAGSTSWTAWSAVQTSVSSPPLAVTDSNGIIHVLVLATSGTSPNKLIYERVQTGANATTWTEWQSGYAGGPLSQL